MQATTTLQVSKSVRKLAKKAAAVQDRRVFDFTCETMERESKKVIREFKAK